jgi:hypothetical protein
VLDETLIIDIVKLDHQAMQSHIRMRWFAGRLDKCLLELEKIASLEEMPFDWTKVTGFPKLRYDKPAFKRYIPFYVSCPNIPDIPAHAIPVQLYSNPEMLKIYIEKQMNRGGSYLGVKEYILHTEKRLRRLEDYFAKQKQDVKEYQYIEVSIDNIPKSDIVAIIYSDTNDLKTAKNIMLIGEPDDVRKILGWDIQFTKIVLDYYYVSKIADNFQNTDRLKREYLGDNCVIFVTEDKGYILKIAKDEKTIYGPDYESKELKKDFDELGLTKILLDKESPKAKQIEKIRKQKDRRRRRKKQNEFDIPEHGRGQV